MSKCINCSHDVDKAGICTECRTRHEFCNKSEEEAFERFNQRHSSD